MIKKIGKMYFLVLFYIFRVFKVKNNKVIFTNFNGNGYGDSPKYIAEKLLDKDVDIVWCTNMKLNDLPNNIRQVKYQSIKWIYEMVTAKVWVNNCRFPYYVRKRKQQFYIQTWHGGIALKKIEYDAIANLTPEYKKRMKNDTKMTDVMISNSDMCNKLYRNAFKYEGKILKLGSPRNDVLINDKEKLYIKVRKELHINTDDKILLYAPTFRNDYTINPYNIDFKKVKEVLEAKYKCKWNIIIKLHPNIKDAEKLISNINDYINAQNYSDIQELICASDLLITDYSSTMFETMMADIPVILYANDIKEYNNDRGMYIKMTDLPFPLCENNDEILDFISLHKLNEISENYKTFKDQIGLAEFGVAGEKVAAIILEKMKER